MQTKVYVAGHWGMVGGVINRHLEASGQYNVVIRKITRGLANIAQGLESCLYMGNIDSLRNWGHAKDCLGVSSK